LCILPHWIWQIKELSEDIIVPEYCYAGGGALQSLNAWFGPEGTVTPLHHDPHHNILAQVKHVCVLTWWQWRIQDPWQGGGARS
jgi:hypothetical protein